MFYATLDKNIPNQREEIALTFVLVPNTKDGREWFINIDNPKEDPIFSITSIFEKQDKMMMDPLGDEPWKNIEMTGYVILMLISC